MSDAGLVLVKAQKGENKMDHDAEWWRQNNEFATYDEVYGPNGMADDRDDSLDPEFNDPNGYCEHGNYVGGCGPDLMCHWCEMGVSPREVHEMYARERLAKVRTNAENALRVLEVLLQNPRISGIDAADFAQRSSFVNNPRSRYGRH